MADPARPASHAISAPSDASRAGRRRVVAGRMFDGETLHSPGWVSFENGQITQVAPGVPNDSANGELQEDLLLSPGFVDTHTHGAGGAAFGDSADQATAAVLAHRRHGTTTLFASLISAPTSTLVAQLRTLAPMVHRGELAGVHLEGPWLSPDYRGAHRADYLSSPSPQALENLLEAAEGSLRMITIAPELPAAMPTIEAMVAAAVTPAIGHTACSYDTARQALGCGARVATHLFNAMPGLHHRDPGPISAFLESTEARVEVIADGVHLHDAVLNLLFAHAPDRVVLVSDAMAAAGLGEGRYTLGDQDVHVSGDRAYLAGTTTLAGSALTLHGMVKHAALTPKADLTQVLRSATSIPARTHLLHGAGHLRPGATANIVCLDGALDIREVIFHGQTVSSDTPRSPGPILSAKPSLPSHDRPA